MEKTRTRLFREILESQGVSPQTAKQASVVINNDMFGKRSERAQRQVLKAWEESQGNAQ